MSAFHPTAEKRLTGFDGGAFHKQTFVIAVADFLLIQSGHRLASLLFVLPSRALRKHSLCARQSQRLGALSRFDDREPNDREMLTEQIVREVERR
jgi:hypothetical protein